jgi:hypothetical protein
MRIVKYSQRRPSYQEGEISLTMVELDKSPRLEVEYELKKLPEVLEIISRKADEETIRFRTCCADPRASK